MVNPKEMPTVAKYCYDLPYEEWTEGQVWNLFIDFIDRDSLSPGLGAEIEVYQPIFSRVYSQMLVEHKSVLGLHFRSKSKKPFVNILNIEHLTRLIHLFSYEIFKEGGNISVLDSMFFIIKSRCGINLFYKQPVGRYFFAFHSLGAVVGYGDFGDFLVISQGITIGQNHNRYPEIGNNVILGPGASVLGRCRIGDNVFVGAGALVIDKDIPENSIVVGRSPDLTIKPNPQDNRCINFDMEQLALAGEI